MAKGFKLLKAMNQLGGFDCPGCAWPDPDDKRALLSEYCENGAKAISEEYAKLKANPAFFLKHTVADLLDWSDMELGKSGRLTHPMSWNPENDKYEKISWDAAFELIAANLNGLADPNQAIFYTSGRTSNEAAYLNQLFVRKL